MVHLGFNVRLRRQLSTKINIPKSSPTTQKCGQGNLTQKILKYLVSTQDTLGAHYGYISGSREVNCGWNIQLQSQMSMNHTKVKDFSHMLNPFGTNPGHLESTLGTSRNCSRVVHLERDKYFQTQMHAEIKVPKRPQTTQKLKTSYTCSTLLHQSGKP